jgi:hypothetical protein
LSSIVSSFVKVGRFEALHNAVAARRLEPQPFLGVSEGDRLDLRAVDDEWNHAKNLEWPLAAMTMCAPSALAGEGGPRVSAGRVRGKQLHAPHPSLLRNDSFSRKGRRGAHDHC